MMLCVEFCVDNSVCRECRVWIILCAGNAVCGCHVGAALLEHTCAPHTCAPHTCALLGQGSCSAWRGQGWMCSNIPEGQGLPQPGGAQQVAVSPHAGAVSSPGSPCPQPREDTAQLGSVPLGGGRGSWAPLPRAALRRIPAQGRSCCAVITQEQR